jgi:hypothetical protein
VVELGTARDAPLELAQRGAEKRAARCAEWLRAGQRDERVVESAAREPRCQLVGGQFARDDPEELRGQREQAWVGLIERRVLALGHGARVLGRELDNAPIVHLRVRPLAAREL